MKKILILLLAAAMLLPCVSAFAAQGDLTLVSDRDSGTEYNSFFCAVLDRRPSRRGAAGRRRSPA